MVTALGNSGRPWAASHTTRVAGGLTRDGSWHWSRSRAMEKVQSTDASWFGCGQSVVRARKGEKSFTLNVHYVTYNKKTHVVCCWQMDLFMVDKIVSKTNNILPCGHSNGRRPLAQIPRMQISTPNIFDIIMNVLMYLLLLFLSLPTNVLNIFYL